MNQGLWYERVIELREVAKTEPHRAGIEALRILEDWLLENATHMGHRNPRAGMREYTDFLVKHTVLSDEEGARARRLADLRNCLAHRSGLLVSPALAEEILSFLETICRSQAMDAEHLMTPHPHSIHEVDSLREARDWMLRNNVSRLPVLRDGRVTGLLTTRDILMIQATHKEEPSDSALLTVGDAMSADSLERIAFVPRQASYDEVIQELQKPNTAAVFVTEHGGTHEPLLGVITVSDILPKL
ncbi:MAG: CBS domain-containing protein [Ardenticatenales bacterium]|nr:CBS domain-containing protein [Ardenticatenales bacterium]